MFTEPIPLHMEPFTIYEVI